MHKIENMPLQPPVLLELTHALQNTFIKSCVATEVY